MSDERRKSLRQKSFLRGHINNGLSDVDCLIRDLSATGARLLFSRGISMPSVIDLRIPGKNQVLRAQVEWRNGDEMGVSFVEAAPRKTSPKGDYAELAERMVRLEADMAALRKMVVRMHGEGSPKRIAHTG